MSNNRISASLQDSDFQNVLKCIDDLQGLLPFLMSLSERDKRARQMMGPNSVGYVKLGANTALSHIDILARNFSVEEYDKDVKLWDQLSAIYAKLNPFTQKLRDTMLVLGQELMEQTNEVYAAAKREAKSNGGLKAIVDEMSRRYDVTHTEERVPTPVASH